MVKQLMAVIRESTEGPDAQSPSIPLDLTSGQCAKQVFVLVNTPLKPLGRHGRDDVPDDPDVFSVATKGYFLLRTMGPRPRSNRATLRDYLPALVCLVAGHSSLRQTLHRPRYPQMSEDSPAPLYLLHPSFNRACHTPLSTLT